MNGKFITIEGQDGAGKSTNLEFIKRHIESHNINVHTTREPGGTKLGEALREMLLYSTQMNCTGFTELLLMFAARSQHYSEVILPKLEQGIWVVSDRFVDASYAYQGAGRGVDHDTIRSLEKLVLNDFKPILTLVLDVPLETAKLRGATDSNDRFEQQQDNFKHRVRKYYRQLCIEQAERVKLIDAKKPLANVQKCIASHLDVLIHPYLETLNNNVG